MRLTTIMAIAAAALVASAAAASAFEVQSEAAAGSLGNPSNFDLAPEFGTSVLERFADNDDPKKAGKLQVFGTDIPNYGIPNYIPGPGNETPYWVYSSPYFRSSR
jgi:hypothetical protein